MKKHTLGVACAAVLLLAACGGGGSTASNETATAAEAPASATPVGQAGKAEGLDFIVTAVATPNSIGPAGVGVKAAAGETFVVVDYTMKNTAAKPLPLMERPGISLIDGAGQSYEPDMAATMMAAGTMDDFTGMASDLNPNISAKSKAVWKLDKAAFDKGTWRVTVAADPVLTFALQ